MPVLVLITRIIYLFTLHFAVAHIKVTLGKKSRKCRAYRTISYKIWGQITPFNTTWTYSVRRCCCFPGNNLHVGVMVLRTLSAISFFPSDRFFYIFKKLKRITCTIFLCSKKYRSPCLFKRKGAFISLSSLLWGKSLTFCTSTRSCARANDVNSVRSRDVQCNTEESP